MKGRRRGIRLHRIWWETAAWFLASRLVTIVAAVLALMVVAAVLAFTRPWQALVEEGVVYVPVPVTVTEAPDEQSLPPGDDDGAGEGR